jgi:SAM-dependent methyltransferase
MPATPFRPHRFASKFPFATPRCYVMGKVLTDPLYTAVWEALRNTREPLLDVGCGMGVLAFYLREHGWQEPCVCLDVDQGKIAIARRIQHQWPAPIQFLAGDAARGLPDHRGSVTLLDLLQYFSHDTQRSLLAAAASRVSENGVLIIRNAMVGKGGRHDITRVLDRAARWLRWMSVMPKDYPDRSSVCEILASHGLLGGFEPLWGRTPFHNWLGVFQRVSQPAILSHP